MLPSQSARSSNSRSHMYRRGGNRRWMLLILAVVAVIGAIIVVRWWSGRGEPASADAGVDATPVGAAKTPTPPANVSARGNDPAPAETSRKSEPPPRKETAKVSMGGAVPPANAPAADHTAQRPIASNPPPATPAQTNATANAPKPASTPPASGNAPPSTAGVSQRVQNGFDLIQQNKPIEARKALSDVLASPGVSESDAARIRQELTKVNERLVFSPEVAADDPYAATHIIASGEALAKLPRKLGLSVDWRFLQRINQLSDPTRIRAGQRIKVMTGPFHAIVDKRAFRMDLYMGEFSDRVYVRSFSVGLGEFGATPEGAFTVKPDSKLIDPAWTNPRTGEAFAASDPKNPLGEFWIGLVGVSDNIRGLESYGIHGTIDPDSVGQERSMGCVRMKADDIALVYAALMDNVSRVEIHGPDWP